MCNLRNKNKKKRLYLAIVQTSFLFMNHRPFRNLLSNLDSQPRNVFTLSDVQEQIQVTYSFQILSSPIFVTPSGITKDSSDLQY